MDTSALVKVGMAAAIPLAAFYFSKNEAIKTGAVVVLGMIAAKNLPLVADAV